jgi:hypothetical protein
MNRWVPRQGAQAPGPEVLFEDIGGDVLPFSLCYWLYVRAGTPAR